MTVSKAKKAKARADNYFSLIVRSRGQCEFCGTRDYTTLTTAHIIGRTIAATRCDLDNAFCLCGTCHGTFGNRPVLFGQFCIDKLGMPAIDALHEKARPGTKVDWEAEAARLKALWLHIEREAS